jgi:hypothetical protein
MTPEELNGLHDPIARQILAGAECRTRLHDIQRALAKCPNGKPGSFETFTVSERSFLLDRPDPNRRAVMARKCEFNADSFLSVFGVESEASALPQDGTEVVGFDKTAGVFDFYVREGGRWNFMGNSNDAVADG